MGRAGFAQSDLREGRIEFSAASGGLPPWEAFAYIEFVRATQLMKKTAFILAVALLTGCAAPPPVKIASKLIGRGLLKNAKNETQTPDTAQSTAPQ